MPVFAFSARSLRATRRNVAYCIFVRVPDASRATPVLGDEVMAAALIDRLLHHCHIVNIRGNSYRMREHQDWLRAATEKRHQEVTR